MKEQPSEILRKLNGIYSLNPFPGNTSSPRAAMFSTHIGQALVIKGSTIKRIQTGMEKQFGKYTFSVKMPCNAEVIKVIDRYRPSIGGDTIRENPSSVVIYENVDTKEVSVLELTRFCSHHQYFGFEYKPTKHFKELKQGAAIPKDTILLDSPSITDEGEYKYGRECNIAFMTVPGVSEDGIIVSEDILPHYTIKTYDTRIIEFGKEFFPLNLYGTKDNFKAFPDIGERIRDDGILMALREYDDMLAPVEQNINDLMEVDHFFDKAYYASGGGGKIIDIKVHHDPTVHNAPTPSGMETQAMKYDNARRIFYKEIIHEYERLSRERGHNLKIHPKLHRLLVEAYSVVAETEARLIRLNGKNPLDDWRIEFTIEYEKKPVTGFKMTDIYG